MLKKRDIIAQRIERYSHIFRCPVCGDTMRLNKTSLVCPTRHTFDLASRGYLNLLLRPAHTRYDSTMLAARQQLCRSGFFAPLIEAMYDLIEQADVIGKQPASLLLDAGCGEGSHLSELIKMFEQTTPQRVQGVGLDISKDGIRLAVRDAWDIIWCVANLSQLPIQDQQCQIVTNILSPANYAEFTRVLTPDGILLKVVPGDRHLAELRALLSGEAEKAATPPERITQHFESFFTMQANHHLTYANTLLPEQVPQLLTMTPLSWNITEAKRETVLSSGLAEITVDLHILVGRTATTIQA